jgi:calcium-translocating P-type ATPase
MESDHQNKDQHEPWHALDAERVSSIFDSALMGLTDAEAVRRLERYGLNVIERTSGEGALKILFNQINNPLIWVLIGSILVALALGKVTDGLVVLAVVVLNSLIGFFQEYRAGRAIEALSQMVPENAVVMRDTLRKSIPVAELVPGDIVLLASGDRVPTDMRILSLKNLKVDEAALTGESVPVHKRFEPVAPDAPIGDRTCMVFCGTLVTYGTATCLVVATGEKTEIGRISKMIEQATSLETPMTKAMASVAKVLTALILAVAVVVMAVGTFRSIAEGNGFFPAFRESMIFAIALAVGAIPEGLPAIVTIALAIGVRRMASRRAIIRKLPAVQTLGATTVICTDKTGTLTAVSTRSGYFELTGAGYDPIGSISRQGREMEEISADVRELLTSGALCNDAVLHRDKSGWKIVGDPTEGALVVAAEKAKLAVDRLRLDLRRIDAIPFESENQFMATLHALSNGGCFAVVKGAPEVVVERCDSWSDGSALDKAAVLAEADRLAVLGMRVLALARKEQVGDGNGLTAQSVQGGFSFLGLAGMIDPPRTEAIAAVRNCQSAGITVKMITGDHKGTAKAIGRQLGLIADQPVLTGSELAQMDDEQLRRAAASTHVFARVAPEHKLALVKALQDQNQIVAMTGDGVNDAPALKQANIGVAMGITGTSVSRESADIVLADDNFASIVAAIEEGRRVYDNLIKSLAFVVPTNLGLAMILVFAVVFLPFDPKTKELLLPILPTQLLWINLIAAVALALPLAFEAKEPDVMKRPPRRPNEPLFNRFVVQRTVMASLLMTVAAIAVFDWCYKSSLDAGAAGRIAQGHAQTMAVTTVIMFQIFYMANCRSLKDSVFKIGLFSNKMVFVGIASVLALQAIFVYAPGFQRIFGTSPLGIADIGITVLLGSIVLPIISFDKWVRLLISKQG